MSRNKPKSKTSSQSSRRKSAALDSTDYVGKAIAYANAVLLGEVSACKWVRLACQRHLDDLEKAKKPRHPYFFDETRAVRVCRFIEQLPHTKGDWAARRQNIRLEPWQCFVLCSIFGWIRRDDETRRYRIAYIAVPRKNGKSILAGGIGTYMFAADNEFGAEVYSGATSEKQAWEVFRPAKQMVERTPRLKEAFGIYVGAKNMAIVSNGSRFEPVIGKPGDGASPSCAIVDEYHEHDSDELFDTMRTGMGARKQPLLLGITTAGSNLGGPCHMLQGDVEKVLEGSIQRDELFGIIYTLDTEPHWDVVQSSQTVIRLDNICDCGVVRTTQASELVRAVCAKHATTDGGAPTQRSGARTTQRGTSEQRGSVEVATSSRFWKITQKERSDRSENEANGPPGTRSGSGLPIHVGDPSPRAGDQWSTADALWNTASRDSNTKTCANGSQENAGYADGRTGTYAWIIATLREKFGDSSANHAIRQSVFWEILRKLYGAHSPTCEALKKSRIDSDGTVSVLIPEDDWTSDEANRKANPNYDISISGDFLRTEQTNAIRDSRKQNVYKTKHQNVWVGASVAWMNMQRWNQLADVRLSADDFKGCPCWVAVDLSSKLDITARVKIFKKKIDDKDHFYVFGDYYLPEERASEPEFQHYQKWVHDGHLKTTPGNMIDYATIQEDTIADIRKFKVLELGFDPWNAAQFAQEIEKATPAKIIEIPQQVRYLSDPMKQTEALVVDGRLHHDGNPCMTWMMSNVVAHTDVKENIYPRKEKDQNKIDGPVALIMAGSRAFLSNGPAKSVYSTRGLLTL